MTTEEQDTLKPWTPMAGIPEVLFCEALHDDEAGVRIDLAPPGSRTPAVRITFESVIAYQNVNETYRHRTWQRAKGRHPTLLVVENSSWLSWLKHESGGILDDVQLVHYAIYTPEDCIDVASRSPPTIELVTARP